MYVYKDICYNYYKIIEKHIRKKWTQYNMFIKFKTNIKIFHWTWYNKEDTKNTSSKIF